MGVKGLSKNVIKQVWRDDTLKALPNGTRVGVDVAGWLHKAVQGNAADIVREKGTTAHHDTMVRCLQQLLLANLEVVLVLDGARWPLKSTTHARRASARAAALEKADAAVEADDWPTAEKFYKQAVRVPDEFVSWFIEHVKDVPNVRLVVANYEADAQLAKLAADGELDLVYSAAQDSDFLLYNGMGDIMYDLRQDGAFHRINHLRTAPQATA
jgi:5'-3' exonuclease